MRRGRWHHVLKIGSPPASAGPDTDGRPEDIDLRRAIQGLPEGDRLLIVLRYYLDLDYDEAGRVLGISPKAAKSRMHRALQRLRLSPEVTLP